MPYGVEVLRGARLSHLSSKRGDLPKTVRVAYREHAFAKNLKLAEVFPFERIP